MIKILSNVEVEIKKRPDRFKQLAELIEFVNIGVARCTCGSKIEREDLRYYAGHDGGLDVPYEDKCWVFAHCPRCDNDLNFRKIMQQKDEAEYDREKGVWRY